MRDRKIRVGILFGGKSGEHEVSYCSAVSVIGAIDKEKYEVVPIGITKEGKWISPKESLQALQSGIIEGESAMMLINDSSGKALIKIRNNTELNVSSNKNKIDVIFPVLHGPFGEDGTVQGMLELADIPYVGAGVAASAISMDKDIMKIIFKQNGLPVLDWFCIKRKDWKNKSRILMDMIHQGIPYPIFVKPSNLGSSVGITKVHKKDELREAIDLASSYDRKILIERGIENTREFECSILGNDEPQTSVVGEVVPAGDFYDYQSKYLDEKTRLIIPAKITQKIAEKIQKIAVSAFNAVDAAGMARVDFLYSRKTGEIFLNEINTIPGFTKVSMYPRLWESSGLTYSDLIDRLIQLAMERYRDKNQNKTVYNSKLLTEK